jgi:hypothetical protein
LYRIVPRSVTGGRFDIRRVGAEFVIDAGDTAGTVTGGQ